MAETMEERVTRLLLEHAQNVPAERPFPARLSIRKDLAVESLSLVAVTLALGDELNVDVTEVNIDFGGIETVGDLVNVARALAQSPASPQISAAG
jgi:acyl carrier protein